MLLQKKLKVASINSWAEPLAIEKNIAGIKYFLDKLESQKVQYALFPELSISGYINNTNNLNKYAKSHESVLQNLKEISESYRMTFSVGLPMPLGEKFGIAQLTYSAGSIIHVHFKTHLSVHEKQVFISGDNISTFENKGVKMGMQLCLESHYPELSIVQQQQGAELICFAFASPRETPEDKLERFKMMLQARAYDNICFVMACNQTGKTPSGKNFAGVALILSPRGKVLAQCASMQADYCMAELDFEEIYKIKNSVMSNFPAYRNTEIEIKVKNANHTKLNH